MPPRGSAPATSARAGLPREWVRASDCSGRLGGAEFVVVLPDASFECARQKAEKIRESLKRLGFRYRDKPSGPITASFGVALFPVNAGDPDSLIAAADEALYEAKRAGRDRVVVCSASAARSQRAARAKT